MASLIQQWLESWGYRKLHREVAKPVVARKSEKDFSFRSALILLPADQPEAVAASDTIKRKWAADGVDVERLGYYADKLDHPEAPCSYFNRKALDLKGWPQGEEVDRIRRSAVDVLLLVSHDRILPLDWIALAVPARLKIAHSLAPDLYDLRLDGHHDNLDRLVRHADQMIETLKTSTHVIA